MIWYMYSHSDNVVTNLRIHWLDLDWKIRKESTGLQAMCCRDSFPFTVFHLHGHGKPTHTTVLMLISLTLVDPRVEAGSKTSTVALRVVEDDEKGTQCLGV
jgi:hypothetical protein